MTNIEFSSNYPIQRPCTTNVPYTTRGVASGGASGAWPSHLKYVPSQFKFGSLLLHTPNTVLKKCAPHVWFLTPLLRNPGDGPVYHSLLKTALSKQTVSPYKQLICQRGARGLALSALLKVRETLHTKNGNGI